MATTTGSALPSAEATAPFRSLYIHTHDVSRSLKPSADGELAHAIHQTLHFALDGHPDDYTPSSPNSGADSGCGPLATMPTTASSSTTNGASTSAVASGSQVKKGFFPTGDQERPYISYHWRPSSATLSLPNPATITNPIADPCSPDLRSSYEITAKFFFLDPHDLSPFLVDDALSRLTSTTGIITVDTLVLSFPTLDLDSRPHKHSSSSLDASTSEQSNGEASWASSVRDVWSHVSQNPQLFSLGLSDVSATNVDLLLNSLSPPIQPPSMPLFSPAIPLSTSSTQPSSSTSHPQLATSDVPSTSTNGIASFWNMEYSLVSTARRPRLVSINVKQDPCAFDRSFDQYCSQMGIQLVAHSDRKDVLPQRTLPALMDEFKDKLPVKAEAGKQLRPKWALKYTTLIRDRGVLADKGYIVFVSSD
ncbi:Glutamate-cysteine ligase modifier subunit [Pseudozyma hubeiensis]|nr:Glutamate-cysteine ligase modifier subunit [Pseudozyma hubeiensis]